MVKALMLLAAIGLLSLLIQPVVQDGMVTFFLAALLFVLLAPVVFDRLPAPRPGSRRG